MRVFLGQIFQNYHIFILMPYWRMLRWHWSYRIIAVPARTFSFKTGEQSTIQMHFISNSSTSRRPFHSSHTFHFRLGCGTPPVLSRVIFSADFISWSSVQNGTISLRFEHLIQLSVISRASSVERHQPTKQFQFDGDFGGSEKSSQNYTWRLQSVAWFQILFRWNASTMLFFILDLRSWRVWTFRHLHKYVDVISNLHAYWKFGHKRLPHCERQHPYCHTWMRKRMEFSSQLVLTLWWLILRKN